MFVVFLSLQIYSDQKYICTESNTVYHFLNSNGQIFKLCYKLLHNSMLKFNLYFSDIPVSNILTSMCYINKPRKIMYLLIWKCFRWNLEKKFTTHWVNHIMVHDFCTIWIQMYLLDLF